MPRLVAALVAACVVLSVLVILRSHRSQPTQAPVPGSFGPRGTAGARAGGAAGSGAALSGGSAAFGTSPGHEGTDAHLPQLGDIGENTVPSRDGRRLATEPLPVGKVTAAAGQASPDAFPLAKLPDGTKLAAALRSSSQTSDQSSPVVDENVVYDGQDGAYFPPDAHLAYPDRGGAANEQGTISFWMQPGFNGADVTDNSFVQLRTPDSWANRLQVFKNGVYLRFLFTDNTGIENNIGVGIDKWAPGEWHQITATWGDQVTNLYVDGVLVGQGQYGGTLDVPQGTPLYVGSDVPQGAPGANSVLRDFLVLDRPMDPSEVQSVFQAGP